MIGGVPGTEGVQNGLRSYVYERKREAKNVKRKGIEKNKKGGGEKKRKKKMRKDSPDPGGSALSHFEGDFLKF